MQVIPSTMYWGHHDPHQRSSEAHDFVTRRDDTLRVLYSMHSSMSEMEAFVQVFSPQQVIPCVVSKEHTNLFPICAPESLVRNESEATLVSRMSTMTMDSLSLPDSDTEKEKRIVCKESIRRAKKQIKQGQIISLCCTQIN